MPLSSPYQVVLGERFAQLHPALRNYFSGIPEHHIGVGEGEFTEFGTTKRWLWPLLLPFERAGVLVAGYRRSVPFRVVNRTRVATDGSSLTVASRELLLPGGSWIMSDSVAAVQGRIVDRLGTPRRIVASFDVHVHDGGLELTSHGVGWVFGRFRARIPAFIAPRVRLRERFDDESGRQHVALTIDVPLIGRVYAYSGYFDYRIERFEKGQQGV